MLLFLALTTAMSYAYLLQRQPTMAGFLTCGFWMGVANGYWVVMVTAAGEQFGTNLRATVATSVPNMVRGSAILSTQLFRGLAGTGMSLRASAAVVCALAVGLSIWALWGLPETFARDLDFHEYHDDDKPEDSQHAER